MLIKFKEAGLKPGNLLAMMGTIINLRRGQCDRWVGEGTPWAGGVYVYIGMTWVGGSRTTARLTE